MFNTRTLGLLLLLAATGCKGTLTSGVDVDLVTDRELLGVVVERDGPSRTGAGVRVVRVLKESPADQAGIRPDDHLLRYGARSLRSSADIASALGAVYAGYDKVDVTLLRGEIEQVLEVSMTPGHEYKTLAETRLVELVGATTDMVEIPFLFAYAHQEVPVDAYLDYTGRLLREPLVLYSNLDFLPILNVFSLFRIETAPGYNDAWRFQITTWPFKFTSVGDGAQVRKELLASGEDNYEIY